MGNILLNETIKVEKSIADEWLAWTTQVYIPAYMESSLVLATQVNRVINSEDDGATFAVQLSLASMSDVHKLHNQYIKNVQKLLNDKYEGRYVIFRTLMEIMQRSEK